MKNIQEIWNQWDSVDPIGTARSHGRVTVEPDWELNTTSKVYNDSKNGPFRWYQLADNSQTELEIPNVKSINIDRSVDTDISTATIEIYNQVMTVNGQPSELPNQLGTPGYLSFGHGTSPEAVARWSQATNQWENILLPNALIRTYQGYGGFNPDGSPMEILDALEDEWITLTGVWLVDEVSLGTSGMLSLKCRDVGKLLGVQQYFPPLVPSANYLEQFCRWKYEQFDAKFNPRSPHLVSANKDFFPEPSLSSTDTRLGYNVPVLGHTKGHATDGNPDTFALSVGHSTATGNDAVEWWEYRSNMYINEIYLEPWGGNYEMYISIQENGVWQTNNQGNIPYTVDGVDVEAGIPYVLKTGVTWEKAQWFKLARAYKARTIRLTFKNLTNSQWESPNSFRAGIRQVKTRMSSLAAMPAGDPWTFSIETYRDPLELNESGYWVVADDGQVFAFGDARTYTKNSTHAHDGSLSIVTIRQTPSGKGYYLLETSGYVYSHGDAVHQGDSGSLGFEDYIDMAITPSGDGYWLLRRDGTVDIYGDAVHYGDATPTSGLVGYNREIYAGTGIESHPDTMGYWIVDGNGEVQAFNLPNYSGIAPFRSGLQTHEWTRGIRRNDAGDGYWIVTGTGQVWARGAATWFGNPVMPVIQPDESVYAIFRELVYAIAPAPNGLGYLVLQANGHIIGVGTFDYFGEPGQTGIQRKNGNYRDYSDIVKLLLAWAGFLYYSDGFSTGPEIDDDDIPSYRVSGSVSSHDIQGGSDIPPVYGNIESTGAYADECIGLDQFDKKPIIDGINLLKEIVGYVFYIDDDGAARFESPNWWSIGNYLPDGTSTDFIPEVDENTVLTDYQMVWSDATARSEIIISTEEPVQGNQTTITTRLVPQTASILRNMVVPAMWINGAFKNVKEQEIMAELIAMHIWFQQRIGAVTAHANPCIQVNDQIRIYERTTAETYIHYVRGISTTHDLDSGVYQMTLTTHWMGDEADWVITRDRIQTGSATPHIQISSQLVEWLEKTNSRKVQVARLNNFGDDPDTAIFNYEDDAT